MKKKKKTKKRKSESIPKLTEQEKESLESILGNLKQINKDNIKEKISNPLLAQELVERLPIKAPETPDLISVIRESFQHKDVQKAIKKTIFRLKQEGIIIGNLANEKGSSPIFSKIEKEEPSAYLSPIDGTGSRGVMVILPQIPKGVDVGIGAVSYENGIVNFIANRSSKRQTRELKGFFFEQAGKSVETSLSHAATILEEAYKRNQAASITEGTEDYLKIRAKILDRTPLLDRPAIHELLDPKELSDRTLTDSQILKFLDHELMETWIIPPDKIKSLMEEIYEAENSQILISQEQKANRVNEIMEKAVHEIYPEPKRLELKNMLEEMAYVFFKVDEEEYARFALTLSLSLDTGDSFLRTNPFLIELLERSLDFYEDMIEREGGSMEDEDDSSSSIILP